MTMAQPIRLGLGDEFTPRLVRIYEKQGRPIQRLVDAHYLARVGDKLIARRAFQLAIPGGDAA